MVPQQSGALGPSLSGAIALPYPDRFFAAALFSGFAPPSSSASKSSSISFSDETALLLYSLYQQATVGPCNIAKPWSWNVVEHAKWTSWNQLAKMPSTEAMRLFVRTLEEEDPDWLKKAQEEETPPGDQDPEWWSKAHDDEISSSNELPTLAAAQELNSKQNVESNFGQSDTTLPSDTMPASSNGTIPVNGHEKTYEPKVGVQEPEIGVNEPEAARPYNSWYCRPVSGRRPAARYQHAAAVVGNKMVVIGGNHNGRYLSDVQELDLDTFEWSKVEQKTSISSSPKPSSVPLSPCAGHSLVEWGEKLLVVAGHSKELSDLVTVRAFDLATSSWSILPTYGQAPVARGGQTVTKVADNLIMFGGEDSKRRLYNDLHILDLETMIWDVLEAGGTPPSPRSDHAAAQHDQSLLVFGGGSHSSCFNDLHVLDFETMAWSQPPQKGFIPSARAGHAAVTIGDNWYIMGGGDNKSGISDTLVLSMSSLVWHVIATEEGRTPITSEGLSVVTAFADGAVSLISFGGYNGRYSNEVHIFKTGSPPEKAKQKVFHSAAAAAAAASAAAAFAVSRSQAAIVMPPVNEDTKASNAGPLLPQSSAKEFKELELQDTDTQNIAQVTSNDDDDGEVDATLLDEKVLATTQLQVELEAAQSQALKLKQDLANTINENWELDKELAAVRGQLAAEQSRCFRLEVDVLELRQKLQAMDLLQKELDLVRRQRAAAEEAAVSAAAQKPSSGVWSWLAGHQQDQTSLEE